jgi:hypothetical protein
LVHRGGTEFLLIQFLFNDTWAGIDKAIKVGVQAI